jgi:hydrogenase expression/formation protein HypD
MAAFEAKRRGIGNFSLLVSHVLVPPAMEAILVVALVPRERLPRGRPRLHDHGLRRVRPLAERYRVPIVVTGFEPLDILQGITMVRAAARGSGGRRSRTSTSDRCARVATSRSRDAREVFEIVPEAGAASGRIPASGLGLRPAYREFDAERRFAVEAVGGPESRECRSGAVLQGLLKPPDCPAFGTRCTPDTPLGATMVSSEGACAAYYRYRRFGAAMRHRSTSP